jgi:hypothetical protein
MNRLFKISLLCLLTTSTVIFSQTSSSKWQQQPIIIDGDGADWGSLPRFFNADSNMKYEFRNDAQNLYIILKASDRSTQMQLMQAGFSVKLKVKTSPPLKVGIAFKASRKPMLSPLNQEGRLDKLQDKSATNPDLMPKDTAILDGFLFNNKIITSEDRTENTICFARSKSTRDQSTFEIRIPLREIFGNGYALENISITPIQLQVNINELSQRQISDMKSRMGSGMHGGQGRGMGGMRGGGEMGGGEMGEMGGGNMGEMRGGDMGGEMQMTMREGFSVERKSFNIDFKLSTGK